MSNPFIRMMLVALIVGTFAEQLPAQSNQIRFVHDASGNRLTSTLTVTNAATLSTLAASQRVRAGDTVGFNANATGTAP